jgi:hypothetical protein
MAKQSYNTVNVVAAAILAFKANGDKVVKLATYDDKGSILEYRNKDYLYATLESATGPHSPKPLQVSNDTIIEAQELISYINKLITMTILTKYTVNNFIKSLHEIVQKETVTNSAFSYLVWLPKVVADDKKRLDSREISAYYEHTSKFFGKLNDRVQIDFTLIEKRYVRSIDAWSAYGHTSDGNLVSFLTKKEHLAKSGQLKGRIKQHTMSQFHNNALITVLNHVKEQ